MKNAQAGANKIIQFRGQISKLLVYQGCLGPKSTEILKVSLILSQTIHPLNESKNTLNNVHFETFGLSRLFQLPLVSWIRSNLQAVL